MRTAICFLLLTAMVLGDGLFECELEGEVRPMVEAASVNVEQLKDRVAVFLKDAKPLKNAYLMRVKTNAKQHAVLAMVKGTCIPLEVSRTQGGLFYFVAYNGTYTVHVQMADDSVGMDNKFFEVTIKDGGVKPVDPDKPVDPPVGGFDAVRRVAKEQLKVVSDPKVAKALANGYRSALAKMQGKTLLECKAIAQQSRRDALLSVPENWGARWNLFFAAVDAELMKVATTAEAFQAGVVVIAEVLSE